MALKKRPADSLNPSVIDQICEAILPKLEKRITELLTLNQQVPR